MSKSHIDIKRKNTEEMRGVYVKASAFIKNEYK